MQCKSLKQIIVTAVYDCTANNNRNISLSPMMSILTLYRCTVCIKEKHSSKVAWISFAGRGVPKKKYFKKLLDKGKGQADKEILDNDRRAYVQRITKEIAKSKF